MAWLKQEQAAIHLNKLGQEILASFLNFERAFDVPYLDLQTTLFKTTLLI